MHNFSWIKEGEIAGSAHPGGIHYSPHDAQQELELNLATVARAGIGAIVTLSAVALNQDVMRRLGLCYLHLPVEDMSAPTIEDVREFVAFVHDTRRRQAGTLVHCTAGMGRTGTMLACYLVHEGNGPTEAMDEVRRRRPGSIETPAQEALVRQYSELLGGAPGRRVCAN